MDPVEDEQERLGELLFPVMADYADAVCSGDVGGMAACAEQLRRLVHDDIAPDSAREVVDLLGAVVTERWDEDRRAGLPSPGPPHGPSLDDSLRQTERLLLELGAPRGAAHVLMSRGRALQGRDAAAEASALRRAQELFEHLGDPDALRMAALAAGMRHRVQRDHEAAAAAFIEAARRSGELGLPQSRAACLAELAAVRNDAGDHGAAADDYRRAADIARGCGASDQSRFWGVCAADAALASGREAAEAVRLDEALSRFRQARVGYLAGGSACALGAANAALHLGVTAFARNEPDLAEEWFRTADTEFAALADPGGAGAVHLAWGNALMSRGDAQAAEPLLRRAHGELIEAGQLDGAAACLRLMAASAFHRGDRVLALRLFQQAEQVLADPESAVVAQLVELLVDRPHEVTATVLDDLRERFEAAGELGKAAGAAMLEVHELFRTGQRGPALVAMARFEDLVHRASSDPRSRYALPMLSWMPGLMRAAVFVEGGPTARQAALRDCHEAMVAAGVRLPAARLAVQLAGYALAAGDPQQAANRAVPALLTLHAVAQTLPDAGERRRWAVVVADAADVAVRAANQLRDHRLLAELLEVLRGQAMPEPLAAAEERSLAALLLSTARLALTGGSAGTAGIGQPGAQPMPRATPGGPDAAATVLAAPPAIRMPWRCLALQDHRAGARRYGTELGAAGVVRLIVAR